MRVGVTHRSGVAKRVLATSLLFALSTAAVAQDKPKLITAIPKTHAECDLIFLKVMESVEDMNPVMIRQFLLATDADHVLNRLCEQGNYGGAVDFANNIAEAPTGRVKQQPQNPGECFLGACIKR